MLPTPLLQHAKRMGDSCGLDTLYLQPPCSLRPQHSARLGERPADMSEGERDRREKEVSGSRQGCRSHHQPRIVASDVRYAEFWTICPTPLPSPRIAAPATRHKICSFECVGEMPDPRLLSSPTSSEVGNW
ncbi:hypothetical protein PM082_012684 [Marasmius tenuissimus]|nr:hypothetical protein PM082_012684 [Marasmius tenuissimus]